MDKQNELTLAKPINVLVVEDNLVDKHMLESMLGESPAEIPICKIASTLADAKTHLKQFDFDVIVLDLNLPDSKGEDTLTHITTLYPKIAIVVNTGAYEDDLGLQTLSLGSQDFLVKGKYTAYGLHKALHYAVERKRVELELKDAYERLKDTQNQLIQSEKLKVVGGLASGVAHEVKNPLATILYGVTYLEQNLDLTDEKIKTVIEHITDASNRANMIVTDLLDFASLTRLNKQWEDINTIVEKALSLTRYEIEKNRVAIKRNLNKNLSRVNVDHNKIEQVLVNLVLNANYAMASGGELFVSTLEQTDAAGTKHVVIQVEDTGCGIPEEKLNNIFDPFFTTRRANGGVGLGLSVSRNIMNLHQGTVVIENRLEGGVRAKLIFSSEQS